jgi:hypothetical protein
MPKRGQKRTASSAHEPSAARPLQPFASSQAATEHGTSKQQQNGAQQPAMKRAKTGLGAAVSASGSNGYAAPSALASLTSCPPTAAASSSAAVGPASGSTGAAADGAPRALEIELAAGLQAPLRQIAADFSVSSDVALREFVRFLELKQFMQDSRPEKLSPHR